MLLMFVWKPAKILSSCIGAASLMVFPTVSALKANAVRQDQQGRIQGAVAGLQSFTQGVGPLFYGSVFSDLHTPGCRIPINIVFVISSVMLLPAVLAALFMTRGA